MSKPLISVLIPVHDSGRFLPEAVGSILKQTFCDFELILVDDGSADGMQETIDTFRDSRIRTFRNPYPTGAGASLNAGLRLSEGRYVCMMDPYDIAAPDRLEVQFRFMERNPQTAVAGSFFVLSAGGRTVRTETACEALRVRLLAGQASCHPTQIMRNDMLRDAGLFYDDRYLLAGDYEFMVRAVQCAPVVNLPVALLRYRSTCERPDVKYDRAHRFFSRQVVLKQLELFGIAPETEEADLHFRLMRCLPLRQEEYESAVAWATRLAGQNRRSRIFDQRLLECFLRGKLAVARRSAQAGGASVDNNTCAS